jgi:RNA polymerase sigma-70 factor, ECF subfamily
MRKCGGPKMIEADLQAQPRFAVAEADLIARAQRGDEEAWCAIYTAYHPRLYAYAYHRIGDISAAEDIAAQVFADAVAHIHRFGDRGQGLGPWLYRLAHNRTIDYFRGLRRKPAQSLEASLGEPVASGAEVDADLLRGDVMALVRRLRPDDQQILILRFVEGLSPAEISAVLGKREGAVRTMQSRALARLAELARKAGLIDA